MNLENSEPQMKAPRVTHLEGVYTSTVAPVDVAHTYGSPPYVDIAARYACGHTWVRSQEPAGFRHDERRYFPASEFGKTIHRKGRKERKAMQQEQLRSCAKKIRYDINNELRRTKTNSGFSEFVRVRISSLLTSILFLSLRPLRSLRLDVFSTPAHERAPPALAVHLRTSRAGGWAWRAGG